MKIDGNTFKCRFNVAILDDGYYLPMDKYLFVYHDQLEYIDNLIQILLIKLMQH